MAAAGECGPAARILIDGRSGSGKTTLARVVGALAPTTQVIGLDEIYPGWDGLREGADRAFTDIIRPHAEGRWASWREWDWALSRPGAARTVDPARPLLIEGAGLLTIASAALGDVRVWVDAPSDERRRRALLRDGETYAPHWERWARQEEEHLADHAPESLATIRVDGADHIPADAAWVSPSRR